MGLEYIWGMGLSELADRLDVGNEEDDSQPSGKNGCVESDDIY